MPLIRANHIVEFGNQAAGRDRIGELMRRLVWAWSATRVEGMSFHANDSNNFPGWDGWVQLRFDPGNFRSVWELSTNESSPLEKIRRDSDESLSKELPDGWERSSTTYVAVTSRKLQRPATIREELKSRTGNLWADVQVIDANILEQWIEKCPAVEQWMGEEFSVGLGKFGETIQRRWMTWSGSTRPQISTSLVLAGRKVEEIMASLESAAGVPTIQADSPDEAVSILFSAIESLPAERKNVLLANALVISTKSGAESYSHQQGLADGPRLTVLMPSAASAAHLLVQAGHKVILALGRVNSNYRGGVIRRALRSEFEAALINSMGFTEPQANSEARACGSSVSIWRVWNIHRETSSGEEIPLWASPPHNRRVVPAVLARSWNSDVEGDISVVAALAEQPFENYSAAIQEFMVCDDPLHELAGTVTKVIAPSVAYALISRSITPADIERFAEVTTLVFGTIESSVSDVWDTESDTPLRSSANTYSEWIRDGLSETLLAMAFLPEPSTGIFNKYGGGQSFANDLVERIPGLKSDPRVLASLRDQLPLLAEAAPLPFVNALESILQGATRLEPLFADRGLFGSRFHVGIIWALEVLCWSPEYLSRAALILAELNDRYGKKELGNSPLTSLKEIFLAWHPGTSASITERTSVLALIERKYSNTGWRLLLSLLPASHGDTSGNTQVPSWRDFGRSEMKSLTKGDLAKTYRAYTELALSISSENLSRQLDLLKFYAGFPDEYKKQLIRGLSMRSHLESSHRTAAWNQLRTFIAKNRSFSSATWSVSESDLKLLDAIASSLVPTATIEKHKWLFDDSWPQISSSTESHEKQEALLEKLRLSALTDILQTQGMEGIDNLIRATTHPQIVGQLLPKIQNPEAVIGAINSWALSGDMHDLEALRMASSSLYSQQGTQWIERLKSIIQKNNWPTRSQAWSLLGMPTNTLIFQTANSLGSSVEAEFWTNCWIAGDKLMESDLSEVASKLIVHRRATYLLSIVSNRPAQFGSQIVKECIEASIAEILQGLSVETSQMFAYYVSKSLSWLRKQPDIDRMSLLSLEYPLVSVLTGSGSGDEEALALHEALSTEPKFFIDVICDAYGPATGRTEGEIDANMRNRATAAWRLLHSWKTIPGLQANQTISEKELRCWIDKARELALERDRADIVDQKIGEVLFHSPGDHSHSDWPPSAVIGIIEQTASKHLEQGFELECFNSRGTTTRAPLSGGSLERSLEEFWNIKASTMSLEHQRTRAMFKRIADDWKHQAKWHDDHSEQMRMRWS